MKTRGRDAVGGMLSEWKRGMLSFWVLGLLLSKSRYGLEIQSEIQESTQGRITLGASTLYTLLRRLERKGFVKSRWASSPQGPPRAYYNLTPAGRGVVRRFAEEILDPQSPINAGLGRLTAALFREFGRNPGRDEPHDLTAGK
ncbi:MAG: PadR family transcriptional regulator [Anaerolineales bacterium]|nr:PadR family transcriptional regulator [Anaerolineales bacterium]